jgi:hypothetical protein
MCDVGKSINKNTCLSQEVLELSLKYVQLLVPCGKIFHIRVF